MATIQIGDQSLKITFPGGAVVPVMVPAVNPNDLQIAKALLGQASGALAPLVPIFNVIDAILAIKGFADAIPASLGPPPDPSALSSALGNLSAKVAELAQLIPQLSVPLMILDLIDVTITSLNGIVTQLEAVVVQEAKIAAAATTAAQPGNSSLLVVVTDATALNVSTKGGISEGAGALNSFLGVLNIFLGLIGASSIPNLAALPSDTQDAIDDLKDLVKVLQDLRATIPVP